MVSFEWDSHKSAANLVKHGISFEAALSLWDGPTWEMDTYAGTDESRVLVVGLIDGWY